MHYFPHFALRLSERYGLLITFDEYVELCKAQIPNAKLKIEEGKPDVYMGYLKINGVKVRVYRSKEYKVLTTAVPMKYQQNKKKKHEIQRTKRAAKD